MYDSILYPTDGSEGAERAFEHVKQLGDRFDATVHVLFVADSGFGETPMRVEKSDDGEWQTGMLKRPADNPSETGMLNDEVNLTDALEREGKQFTEEVAASLEDAGVKAVSACRVGVAPKAINEYAETNDIDVIVMGTHGRSGFDRRLIGSVTEKIVRESHAPVLSVNLGHS